jgi:hypothetical protein
VIRDRIERCPGIFVPIIENIYNDIRDVLRQFCRENGRRHGYCTDHDFHRNAILAFDRKSISELFSILTFLYILFLILLLFALLTIAKNVPLVASAMKKTRALNGYFESSTQAMAKLLNFQRTTEIEQYKVQAQPKKPLQDVVTFGRRHR